MDLKVNISVAESGNAIQVKNITSDEFDRLDYALCIFWSNDNFVDDFNMLISEPFGTDYIFPIPTKGTYSVQVYALPIYDALESYDHYDMVFHRETVTGYQELVTNYYSALEDRPGAIDGNKWIKVGNQVLIKDVYDYFSNTNNTPYVQQSVTIDTSLFKVQKREENTYQLLVPVGVSRYTAFVFKFEEYINNKPASLEFNESNTINSTFIVGDGIYIVIITESGIINENSIYHVLYNFDSLRKIMKALLLRIFCNTHLPSCPIDIEKQKENDRLFITKVSVALGTMLGMIHSEQVDHYHYFSFNEARLSSLQRANDIMQKTLLLYSEYNYDLPCHCHVSEPSNTCE